MKPSDTYLTEINGNKKVLLRERKRHTARRVASTPYVVLTGYPPRQGTPPARDPPGQGTPHGQGTPPARVPPPRVPPLARVPPPARVPPWPGYPPGWTWQGTPPAAPWHSGKCCKALWDTGTPPPPDVNRLKTLPSPILRMRAVTNRVTPEWGCNPFWSDSILFSETSLDSALTLTLGVNGPLPIWDPKAYFLKLQFQHFETERLKYITVYNSSSKFYPSLLYPVTPTCNMLGQPCPLML